MSQSLDFSKISKDIKFLVVDDHALTRTMVQSILKGVGFSHVKQADSGMNAIEKLANYDFDLVICDWRMPNGSGIDVLRCTRKAERNREVLFLMLTGEGYRENVDQAISEGTSSFVVKPFTADVLLVKIYELCWSKFSKS